MSKNLFKRYFKLNFHKKKNATIPIYILNIYNFNLKYVEQNKFSQSIN